MKLTLGFSPCPNDTFIFDALVNGKIDTGDFEFEVLLEDVQTLNEWALAGKLAITKLSYGVLPLVTTNYAVLNSGSALGRGVGPLLIAPPNFDTTSDITQQTIAIPGENTTAHLLFSTAYPQATQKVFLRYDAIEPFVLSGKGLGVIIHENRFTYAQKGLVKIKDLGDFWEQHIGHAIPLGGIAIQRSLPVAVQQQVDQLILKSLQYAFAQTNPINDYIKCHAQEMSEAVMLQHIQLYVNDYSLQLGETGKTAVLQLLKAHPQQQNIDYKQIFVPESI
jgi:1,4-dihydroxy-6-naphthoate synthase